MSTPPWLDLPSCPECIDGGLVMAWVDPEDDLPDEEDGMYPSEELAALNDCDTQEWCWCRQCLSAVDVGVAGRKQALKADAWWDRDDREHAWSEVLRMRKVDEVAAEHARRQIPMFGAAKPSVETTDLSDGEADALTRVFGDPTGGRR